MKFIADLRDRGADREPGGPAWPDFLMTFVPASVACVSPFISAAWSGLAHIPEAQRILRLAVPTVVLFVLVRVIGDTLLVRGRGVNESDRLVYRYGHTARQAAKAGLLLIGLVWMVEFVDVAPNAIFRRSTVSGYLCQGHDGRPVFGQVESRATFGDVVSRASVSTDDTGYFVLALEPWSARPRTISVDGACVSRELEIRGPPMVTSGCNQADLPPRPPTPRWSLSCRNP